MDDIRTEVRKLIEAGHSHRDVAMMVNASDTIVFWVCYGLNPKNAGEVDFIRKLHAEGKSDRQIAIITNMSESRIGKLRRYALGLEPNRVAEAVDNARDNIIRRLNAQGLIDHDIARRIGSSTRAVARARKRLGLPANGSDAHDEADERDATDYDLIERKAMAWSMRSNGSSYSEIADRMGIHLFEAIKLCRSMPKAWQSMTDGKKSEAKTAHAFEGCRRGRTKRMTA
ncbi:MAG: hypothetical protein JNK93_10110 [Planctomycetia bacterium]|nr:hypothetical protein [Planctomycetia bacterium]